MFRWTAEPEEKLELKHLLLAAGLACIPIPLAGLAAHAQTRAETDAAVTVQQVAIGAAERRMILSIWHPAAREGTGPRPRAGGAASVSGSSLPLVIISHGTGGGPMAHVDTAEALAGAGFVVAAPMHRGDNFQDDSSVGRPEWMENRSRDVSRAIDYMLQEWPGRAQLDAGRVGIFGFSAGATTALVALGGVPDLARLAPHCAAHREFVCGIMRPEAEAAGAPPPRWTHDPRIAAAVIAAPGLGFLFEPGGLANVRAPVQLWVGAEDDTVPFASNAAAVRGSLPRSPDFHSVDGAVHLSFLAPCTAETPPQLCEDRQGFDRAAFHREFNRSVIAFFSRHLSSSEGRAEP